MQAKAPDQADAAPRKSDLKTQLKAAPNFAEGEALVTPVQAKGGHSDGKKGNKGKEEAGTSGDTDMKPDAPLQTKTMDPTIPRSEEVGYARTKAEDLRSQNPDDHYTNKMTSDELTALVLYTSNAAYSMNEVLRGIEKDPRVIAYWTPWTELATAALLKAKGPARASLLTERESSSERAAVGDEQAGRKKDATFSKKNQLGKFAANRTKQGRADKKQRHARRAKGPAQPGPSKEKRVPHVYRMVKFPEAYEPVFQNYRVGGVIEEKGFMSTAKNPAYGRNFPIQWRIWDPTGGKIVEAVSNTPGEEEVLFAPGQRVQIDSLKFVWRNHPQAGKDKIRGPKTESVSGATDRFPLSDRSPQAWNDHKEKVWDVEGRILPPPGFQPGETESEESAEEEDAALSDVVTSESGKCLPKVGGA